jgi:hypothetical protein
MFEDPKSIIAETNLAFSHNTYYVKIKLTTYLFYEVFFQHASYLATQN